MNKMFAVVLYDSEKKEPANPFALLVESNESGISYATLQSLITERFKNPNPWDTLLIYEISEEKAQSLVKTGLTKCWPVCHIITDQTNSKGIYSFCKQISRQHFDESVSDEIADQQQQIEDNNRFVAIMKQVGKAPLLSHVNAGCSLAASIGLLAVASYLLEQAATVGSLGFEVGAGVACAAFVGCVVWAVFALLNYARVERTGDKTDEIKHMLIANFNKPDAAHQNKPQEPEVS